MKTRALAVALVLVLGALAAGAQAQDSGVIFGVSGVSLSQDPVITRNLATGAIVRVELYVSDPSTGLDWMLTCRRPLARRCARLQRHDVLWAIGDVTRQCDAVRANCGEFTVSEMRSARPR